MSPRYASSLQYRLLERLFESVQYKHRASNTGDLVAIEIYEDLYDLAKSSTLVSHVDSHQCVVNLKNTRQGVKARRGDGTFGELVPGTNILELPKFRVARGNVATVEIGVEVKILSKAMIKQISRVKNDLRDQIQQFKRKGGAPICVGIVGVNWSSVVTSYEKDRVWRTTGKSGHLHPIQEAAEAEARLMEEVAPLYDEFLVLRYEATNEEPFPFDWRDYAETLADYGAILTRISREYEKRFHD
jgi:hypothetical protein